MSPKIGISDIRREELTQAAMECIANKGYDRVTLDDVTKEAGLSKGIASYYFRNREELLVSVIEKMSAQIEELTIKIWGLPEDTKDKEKDVPPVTTITKPITVEIVPLANVPELLELAEKLYAEKGISSRNLYDAIQNWQKGLASLKRHDPSSSLIQNVEPKLEQARVELDERFERDKQRVQVKYNQKDYQGALRILAGILASIPDREDERYKWAKSAEMQIKGKQ